MLGQAAGDTAPAAGVDHQEAGPDYFIVRAGVPVLVRPRRVLSPGRTRPSHDQLNNPIEAQ